MGKVRANFTEGEEVDDEIDLAVLGPRIRHARRARGLTLAELAGLVDRAPSLLSQIENGRREPRLALLGAIARALDTSVDQLLRPEPPTRRAALELGLSRAQQSPLYATLGRPALEPSAKLPTEVLEVLVGMHEELVRAHTVRAATPEEARRANTELRAAMRARGNYFAEIETVAGQVSAAGGRRSRPRTARGVNAVTEHLGFTVHRVSDLPRSTRSIIDSRHRRIFLPAGGRGGTDPRAIVLQTLGHVALDHAEPTSYADFLRQRVEVNYFAAALLVPEASAVDFLRDAKADRALAIDDLRDAFIYSSAAILVPESSAVHSLPYAKAGRALPIDHLPDAFSVSYATAAHRFTNLATRHLYIPVHFMRVGEDGVIYKAYENDDVTFPTDVTGAIEGQTVCRYWASRAVFRNPDRYATHHQYTDMGRGTYWCTTHVERTGSGDFAIDVGVPFEHARWFQGRDTTVRARSTCPDPGCCRRPPTELAERWAGERSEEHTSELQSRGHLVCRLLLETQKVHGVPN